MRRIDAFHVRVLSPEKNTRKSRCHKRIMSFIGGFHTRPRGGLEAGSSTAQPTKQRTFRSGECRCQSFVCQVQENLKALEVYPRACIDPILGSSCAERRILYPTNPIFTKQRNLSLPRDQILGSIRSNTSLCMFSVNSSGVV
jgi:hypothetical protein